jgi:hypothetical protein
VTKRLRPVQAQYDLDVERDRIGIVIEREIVP